MRNFKSTVESWLAKSRKDKATKLARLSIVKEYEEWKKIPFVMQEALREAWDTYCEKVRETPSYKVFQLQKKAYHNGDMKTVIGLAKTFKEHREAVERGEKTYTLKKPSLFDPAAFEYTTELQTWKNLTEGHVLDEDEWLSKEI